MRIIITTLLLIFSFQTSATPSDNAIINQLTRITSIFTHSPFPNDAVDLLISTFGSMINSHFSVKLQLASDPQTTKDLFFPIISKLNEPAMHFNLHNFPDLSLPNHSKHFDLSLQFYQTLTTLNHNRHFVAELLGLKILDIFSKQQHLKNITMAEIRQLSPNHECFNDHNENIAYLMIYNPSHYASDDQLWHTLNRFHQVYLAPTEFAAMVRNNFRLKLQLVHNPTLTKDILFPMLSKYIRIHGDSTHFPNISFTHPTRHRRGANLAYQFYQTLATSGTNPYFAGRLYGLKMIDFYCYVADGCLFDVDLEDIVELMPTKAVMNGFIDWEILNTIYNPQFYESDEQFWSLILNIHRELLLETSISDKFGTGTMGERASDWQGMIGYWIDILYQQRLEPQMDNTALAILNVILRMNGTNIPFDDSV